MWSTLSRQEFGLRSGSLFVAGSRTNRASCATRRRALCTTCAANAQHIRPTGRHERHKGCASPQQTLQTSHTFGSVTQELLSRLSHIFLGGSRQHDSPVLMGQLTCQRHAQWNELHRRCIAWCGRATTSWLGRGGKERRGWDAGGSWLARACGLGARLRATPRALRRQRREHSLLTQSRCTSIALGQWKRFALRGRRHWVQAVKTCPHLEQAIDLPRGHHGRHSRGPRNEDRRRAAGRKTRYLNANLKNR